MLPKNSFRAHIKARGNDFKVSQNFLVEQSVKLPKGKGS